MPFFKYGWGAPYSLLKQIPSDKVIQDILENLKENPAPIDCALVYSSRKHIKSFLQENPEPYYIEKILPKTLLSFILISENKASLSDSICLSYFTGLKYDSLLENILKHKEDWFFKSIKFNKPVDLLLLHSPVGLYNGPKNPKADVLCWKLLTDLKKLGYVKEIGVSNFNIDSLKNILSNSSQTPFVNQIELHPYLSRVDLAQYCFQNSIIVLAYWVLQLGNPELLNQPVLLKLSKKYHTAVPTVIYQWLIQRNIVPLVGALNLSRLKDAETILFSLTLEEVNQINALNKHKSLRDLWNDSEFLRSKNLKYIWDWSK